MLTVVGLGASVLLRLHTAASPSSPVDLVAQVSRVENLRRLLILAGRGRHWRKVRRRCAGRVAGQAWAKHWQSMGKAWAISHDIMSVQRPCRPSIDGIGVFGPLGPRKAVFASCSVTGTLADDHAGDRAGTVRP